jgi:hypothetical protein
MRREGFDATGNLSVDRSNDDADISGVQSTEHI